MYNNDSDSLNAGAPEIRLTGNQDPNQQMASMEAGQEGTLEDIYYELIGQGFSPADAAKKAREMYNDMSQAPQQPNQQMASASDPMAELNLMYQNALQSGQIAPGTTLDQFKLLLEQSQAPQQNSGIMAAGP